MWHMHMSRSMPLRLEVPGCISGWKLNSMLSMSLFCWTNANAKKLVIVIMWWQMHVSKSMPLCLEVTGCISCVELNSIWHECMCWTNAYVKVAAVVPGGASLYMPSSTGLVSNTCSWGNLQLSRIPRVGPEWGSQCQAAPWIFQGIRTSCPLVEALSLLSCGKAASSTCIDSETIVGGSNPPWSAFSFMELLGQMWNMLMFKWIHFSCLQSLRLCRAKKSSWAHGGQQLSSELAQARAHVSRAIVSGTTVTAFTWCPDLKLKENQDNLR